MGDWLTAGRCCVSAALPQIGWSWPYLRERARACPVFLPCGPTEDGRQRAMLQSRRNLGPHDCELGQASACAEGVCDRGGRLGVSTAVSGFEWVCGARAGWLRRTIYWTFRTMCSRSSIWTSSSIGRWRRALTGAYAAGLLDESGSELARFVTVVSTNGRAALVRCREGSEVH